jgi:hypothetical protein
MQLRLKKEEKKEKERKKENKGQEFEKCYESGLQNLTES